MQHVKVNAISVTRISDGYGQFHTELYVNQVYAAVAYIFAHRSSTDDDAVLFVPTGVKVNEIGADDTVLTETSEAAETMLKNVDYVANFDAIVIDRSSLTEKCRFRVSVKNTIA